MTETPKLIVLNNQTGFYDVILFILTNKFKNICINLDNVVKFISNKIYISNMSKLKTKTIKILGTYDFNGKTKEQIVKKILNDMSKLDINIFVYSNEYDVENTDKIKKIQTINAKYNIDIFIDINEKYMKYYVSTLSNFLTIH